MKLVARDAAARCCLARPKKVLAEPIALLAPILSRPNRGRGREIGTARGAQMLGDMVGLTKRKGEEDEAASLPLAMAETQQGLIAHPRTSYTKHVHLRKHIWITIAWRNRSHGTFAWPESTLFGSFCRPTRALTS